MLLNLFLSQQQSGSTGVVVGLWQWFSFWSCLWSHSAKDTFAPPVVDFWEGLTEDCQERDRCVSYMIDTTSSLHLPMCRSFFSLTTSLSISVGFRKEFASTCYISVHICTLYINRIESILSIPFFKDCPSHATSFPVISRRLGTFSAALTTLEKAGKAFLLWHPRWSPIQTCWEATFPGSVVSRPTVWRTNTATNVIWLMLLLYDVIPSSSALSKCGYGIFWNFTIGTTYMSCQLTNDILQTRCTAQP